MKRINCENCRFFDIIEKSNDKTVLGWCNKRKQIAFPYEVCDEWYSNAVRKMAEKYMKKRYRLIQGRGLRDAEGGVPYESTTPPLQGTPPLEGNFFSDAEGGVPYGGEFLINYQ